MNTADNGIMENLFRQQIEICSTLLKVLKEENSALVNRDAELINAMSQQKSELSKRLEVLTFEQNAVLKQQGYESSPDGLTQYIQHVAPSLEKLRTTLRETLLACEEQNLINANVISAGRRSAEVALALLRGQAGPNQNVTYGAEGQTISEVERNPIAKA